MTRNLTRRFPLIVDAISSLRSRSWFNEHIEGDGETVFRHAFKLGLEDCLKAQGFRLPLRPLARTRMHWP